METLGAVEVRVLGALMEKEMATPEYYPLSLNALVNACNQKSNRDPVVEYDEDTVTDALESLRAKKLAVIVTGGSRVTKYGQRISETLNLGRRESAVLCVLLLRGPQTLGEVKDRCERLFSFSDLSELEIVLDKLATRPDALTRKLPRQPGHKEARFMHLLAGEPAAETTEFSTPVSVPASSAQVRIAQLESSLAQMRLEFDDLKKRFEDLERQLR
jgi:uncharacterized protein